MTEISERFWNSDQSWNFEKIVEHDGFKLRVLIRRNSYDEQSFLRGFALDPVHLQWNQLVHKPILGSRCYDVSYVNRNEGSGSDCESRLSCQQEATIIIDELLSILHD